MDAAQSDQCLWQSTSPVLGELEVPVLANFSRLVIVVQSDSDDSVVEVPCFNLVKHKR